MAKKKEDLGGVWRTVGGRRIFIKDGQDLYEAMNDSGKFTNLKKENFKRKKNDLNKGDVFVNKNGVKVEIVDVDEKGNTLRKMIQPDGKEDFKNFNEKDVKAMLNQNDYKKEASYKVDGKTFSEQDLRKEFDKELERGNVEKGTTYHEWKQGIVDDKNSNVKSETGYIDKRRKEIEFERDKGIYTGARETNPDGSYKHQKEMEAEDTLTSLRKADNWNDINSAIDNIKDEELKTMMKKEAQKLEENENGAWKSADYLARQYNFYKEDFERGKNAKIKIDLNDQDKLNEISDNYENVDKYELDEISRDYILNRRKEISYNKRMNDFVERDKKFREDQERKIVSDYENGEIGYDEVLQKFNGDRSKIDGVFDRNGYISPTTKEAYNDRRTFKNIAKFYGYDKLSNEEIERTLEHAEAKGLYHSKGDIEAMRRYLGRTVIEKDTGSAYSKPGKRWEILEEGKSAFGKPIYKVMDEDGNVMWRDADTFYKKKKIIKKR